MKGITPDLKITNSKTSLCNVKVSSHKGLCKSDHFLINFEIKARVTRRKKIVWGALNNDLYSIDWHEILDGVEPELAWLAFKNIILSLT